VRPLGAGDDAGGNHASDDAADDDAADAEDADRCAAVACRPVDRGCDDSVHRARGGDHAVAVELASAREWSLRGAGTGSHSGGGCRVPTSRGAIAYRHASARGTASSGRIGGARAT